jgi:hypothetical protein
MVSARLTLTEVVPCERHHALQRGDADVQAQYLRTSGLA